MINIFAKRAFLNTASNTEFISKEVSYKGHGHLQRVSSMIRADQIVDYLGEKEARLNPELIYPEEVCIYVKPHVAPGNEFLFETKQSYIDIIDGWGLIPLLEKHPEVGVIACSKQDQEKLSKISPNKIVFIPQQHCNDERQIRVRDKIETVGIIGTEDAFAHIPEGLEEELKKRDIELIKYSKFFSRGDIINFYKSIDVQLVWRPYRMRLSNPLKIVNASSFGIPTIAYRESVFEEMDGCYLPVSTAEEFIEAIENFKENKEFYNAMANRCLRKSENYHISKVAELYKQL